MTTKSNGQEALALLRQRNQEEAACDQFDLVLSDVYMPDMDGFKLLEHIGLELELPVIMMSSNGDTSVVLRGVTHGAVDFLIKPVRIEELKNLWQHVVRRKSIHLSRGGEDSGADMDGDSRTHGTKRKGELEALRAEHEGGAGNKKPRVVWSVEMHGQFVNAVNTLGIDKAVPKRILELMNVEGLTRENVASHLQKYRLYLKRVEGVTGKGGRSMSGGSHKYHHSGSMHASSMDGAMPTGHDVSTMSGSMGAPGGASSAVAALYAQQQAAAAAAAMAGGGGPPGASYNPTVNSMAAIQMAAWQQHAAQQQHLAFQAAVAAAAASGQSIAAMSSFVHPSYGGIGHPPHPSLPPALTHPPFAAGGVPPRPLPGFNQQQSLYQGLPPTSSAGPSATHQPASMGMDGHHTVTNNNTLINNNNHNTNGNGQSSSGEMQPAGEDMLLVGRGTGSSSPTEQPQHAQQYRHHEEDVVSGARTGIDNAMGHAGGALVDHDVMLPAMKDHSTLVVDETLLPDIRGLHNPSMMQQDHHQSGHGFVMPPGKSHQDDPDRDFLDMFIEGMEKDDYIQKKS